MVGLHATVPCCAVLDSSARLLPGLTYLVDNAGQGH